MTETNNRHGNHRPIWPEPPQVFDPLRAAAQHEQPGEGPNRRPGSSPPGTHRNGATQAPADLIAHIVIALSRYVRHLRVENGRTPVQLEDFTTFLAGHLRQRQDVPLLDRSLGRPDPSPVPSRMLLTKREAAQQLGVSLRTIERLISARRLPLVHVEGAARVRVADLEKYVQGLEADARTNPSPPEEQ